LTENSLAGEFVQNNQKFADGTKTTLREAEFVNSPDPGKAFHCLLKSDGATSLCATERMKNTNTNEEVSFRTPTSASD